MSIADDSFIAGADDHSARAATAGIGYAHGSIVNADIA
jgi:hypothetical protein